MERLRVTVIGQELFKPVAEKFELAELNPVNQVNSGMLGNLKTLTYVFELDEYEIIEKTKETHELDDRRSYANDADVC